MTARHAWDKLAPHRYRCRRCGMTKTNVLVSEADSRAPVRWEQRFERAGETQVGATPPCPGLHHAPALTWARVDRYHESADTGHRVCGCRARDGWRFLAYGPDRGAGRPYWEWPPKELARITYPRGTPVAVRSLLLGVYPDAAAARLRCAQDAAGVVVGDVDVSAPQRLET